MKTTIQLFLFAALLSFASCKSSKIQESAHNRVPQGKWVLKSIHGAALNPEDYRESAPTIVFKDSSSFSGTTGCNRYMATYKSTPDNIVVKMGAMTKMACPGNGEQEFVEALNATNRVEASQSEMTFYNRETELLKFEKSESAEIE